MSESDTSYRTPIFIAEDLDVSLYASLNEAERALEGIDVDDGIYVGFDAEGRELRLEARGVRRGRFFVDIGTVHISVGEQTPMHCAELRKVLRDHLVAMGRVIDREAGLETLVEECKRTHKYGR